MTTRRGFFKLMAGAAAMAAVPSIAITKAVPVIFCNGVDCDSAGLDALIRGEVVEFANPDLATHIGWRGDVLKLAGDFIIKTPIKPGAALNGKVVTQGRFKLHSSLFDLTETKDATISHCVINMENCGPNDYAIMVKDRGLGIQYGKGGAA